MVDERDAPQWHELIAGTPLSPGHAPGTAHEAAHFARMIDRHCAILRADRLILFMAPKNTQSRSSLIGRCTVGLLAAACSVLAGCEAEVESAQVQLPYAVE